MFFLCLCQDDEESERNSETEALKARIALLEEETDSLKQQVCFFNPQLLSSYKLQLVNLNSFVKRCHKFC